MNVIPFVILGVASVVTLAAGGLWVGTLLGGRIYESRKRNRRTP